MRVGCIMMTIDFINSIFLFYPPPLFLIYPKVYYPPRSLSYSIDLCELHRDAPLEISRRALASVRVINRSCRARSAEVRARDYSSD